MSGGQSIDLASLKILLFHEEQSRLKEFMSVLRWCGLRDITFAERLSDAFQHIVSMKFDLMIVTHMGEARQTTRLMEEIKGLDATSSLPVVAMTSDAGVMNVLRILTKGVDQVVVMPLSREVFESMVRRLFSDHLQGNSIKETLRQARALAVEGRLDQAKKTYRELLLQAPDSLDVYLGLFRVTCGLKQWHESESYLKSALELAKSCKDKTEAHRQVARIFFHYGNYYTERRLLNKAIKSYRTSLSLNPFHTESVTALLTQLQKQGEVDEIINIIREVHANFLPYTHALEDIAVCVDNIAQTYINLNMSAQARKVYAQLFLIAHENVLVHLKVADFFLEQGLVSQVLKHLFKLIPRLKDADILYKTASVLMDFGKRFLAGRAAEDLSGLDLSFFEGLDRHEILAMTQKTLQQGLLMEPDSPRFQLKLGCCYLRRGEQEKAAEILAKLKEAFGEDADVQALIIDGLLAERLHDLAHIWIKDALARFPKDLRFYQLLARFHREQKRPQDAIECLKRGLSIQSEHLELVVSLAELYQEIGRHSDAVLHYEKAIKLAPADQGLQRGLKKVLQLQNQKERK